MKNSALRRAVPLAAVVACALAPAGAVAKGGGSTPTTSGAPCVKLVPTNSGKKFTRFANVDARFNVTNCGSSPITVGTSVTSVSTAYTTTPNQPAPTPCPGPSATAPALTLKPSETRSVEFSLPPNDCPMGGYGELLRVDATARDSALNVLATATAWYQRTLENL